MHIDATKIYRGLHQGSKPPEGPALASQGFRVLVLAAAEHQPSPDCFPGLDFVLSAPLDDDPWHPMTLNDQRAAIAASQMVADLVRDGCKVLVTCHQGRNRSGLIVALALLDLLPNAERPEIIAAIRNARANALDNPRFVQMIMSQRRRRPPRRSAG